MKKQKTKYVQENPATNNWTAINGEGQILGRLATECAKRIMGKQSPSYTPSSCTGEYIIVYNVEKIILTGNKPNQKKYYRHSGYPGGLKEISYKSMLNKSPEYVLFSAVKGMLPKGRLGRSMLKKLKVFVGDSHKHSAQNPTELKLELSKESN